MSCPELEGQIAKLEEQWLSLNKKIDHELHRLQTLLKHLLRYVFFELDRHQVLLSRKASGLLPPRFLHEVPHVVSLPQSEAVGSPWAMWGLESLILAC